MDYLVKIRSVQTPLNGQFSIGANNYEAIVSRPLLLHGVGKQKPSMPDKQRSPSPAATAGSLM